jgi:hypothetical protein
MMENISDRERKLLMALVPALIITAIVYYATEPSSSVAPVVDTAAAIDTAKLRLENARITAAQLPARQEAKKSLDAGLATWEKRLITADTAAQAQAQLNQIFRRVARVQGPTVEIRGIDIGSVQPIDKFAEIVVNVSFDCQVEGLVNLLTDIASQPEFLSWRDVRVSSPDSKLKRINVTMTLIGLAPAKLLAKPQTAGRG